jgi:hypothetical protein
MRYSAETSAATAAATKVTAATEVTAATKSSSTTTVRTSPSYWAQRHGCDANQAK